MSDFRSVTDLVSTGACLEVACQNLGMDEHVHFKYSMKGVAIYVAEDYADTFLRREWDLRDEIRALGVPRKLSRDVIHKLMKDIREAKELSPSERHRASYLLGAKSQSKEEPENDERKD